jgi:hypothetical protein
LEIGREIKYFNSRQKTNISMFVCAAEDQYFNTRQPEFHSRHDISRPYGLRTDNVHPTANNAYQNGKSCVALSDFVVKNEVPVRGNVRETCVPQSHFVVRKEITARGLVV